MKKKLKNLRRRWRKLRTPERAELRLWGWSGVVCLLVAVACPIFLINALYSFLICNIICNNIGNLRISRYLVVLYTRYADSARERNRKLISDNADLMSRNVALLSEVESLKQKLKKKKLFQNPQKEKGQITNS